HQRVERMDGGIVSFAGGKIWDGLPGSLEGGLWSIEERIFIYEKIDDQVGGARRNGDFVLCQWRNVSHRGERDGGDTVSRAEEICGPVQRSDAGRGICRSERARVACAGVLGWRRPVEGTLCIATGRESSIS